MLDPLSVRDLAARPFLPLAEDIAAEWLPELWTLGPTPAKGARLRRTGIARLLAAHRIRRLDADEVLSRLKQPPLVVAPGTTEAAVAHIRTLIPRLKLVNRQIKDAHRRLDALCAALAGDDQVPAPRHEREQRDAAILRSLPGVGRIVLATLLAEAWEPLQARDYHALRALCGVAPVTKRSGKRCLVIMRQACHLRLRTAVYHWARTAIQHDELSRRRYAELRRRGHSHGRALCTVGDRLLAVACAMLRHGTIFDPNRRHARQPKAA